MKKVILLVFVSELLLIMTSVCSSDVLAWSNGGYSDDPSNPDYGTHDWIAEHALDWLPEGEKRYIVNNLASYLYGTELPDNGIAPDGIGDTTKHHIYYWSNESLQDDASAVRAYEEYSNALNFLRLGDFANASKTAGIMSHYIVDVTVFGHVMGVDTDWGAEEHHSDYETYVNQRTSSYYAEFNVYLSFDGELDLISAYDATKELAYDTTFDVDGDLTCVWMDQNYNWSDSVFKSRCGESLKLAVNCLTDVLHTLYSEAASVHNIDTGLDYLTIQEAMNAPETLDGHTIHVDAGMYTECVNVNKSVSLVGKNRTNTIIRSCAYETRFGTVFYITVNNVTISGFTVRDGLFGIQTRGNNTLIANCSILNNMDGISSIYSFGGIIIAGNNIMNNDVYGIAMYTSNNVISENNIANNHLGISLQGLIPPPSGKTTGNIVTRNNISNNYIGVTLYLSHNNTFYNNDIANNDVGCQPYFSDNNSFYHNNFLNNKVQALSPNSTNFWDDDYPSGGNYWSDYNGTDFFSGPYQNLTGSDGIGDAPYDIDENNQDNYPLMGTFSDFNATSEYRVQTICNSSISNFQFNGTAICFNVTGKDGALGFCKICIPTALINDAYTVFVNGTEVPHTLLPCSNSIRSYLYFTYNHSTQEVIIIPEFQTWTSMLLALIVPMVAIVFYKRRSPEC